MSETKIRRELYIKAYEIQLKDNISDRKELLDKLLKTNIL